MISPQFKERELNLNVFYDTMNVICPSLENEQGISDEKSSILSISLSLFNKKY